MNDTNDEGNVVRLEIDESSLKPYFDNIAEGFEHHGAAIRIVRMKVSALGFGVILALAGDVLLLLLK